MCTLYKILQWLIFFYKIHHQLSIIIHFVKKIKFKQFPDIGWRRLVGDKKSPQPDKTSPQAKRHELSLQVTWTKKLCFFVQVKLSHICDPQKFFNKRDQSIRIFLMFIDSLKHSQVRNLDKKLVGGQWQTCCVFLEARDDSKTANCTLYRNFPNHEFDCLNTSIRKRTSPQTPEILLCTYK